MTHFREETANTDLIKTLTEAIDRRNWLVSLIQTHADLDCSVHTNIHKELANLEATIRALDEQLSKISVEETNWKKVG